MKRIPFLFLTFLSVNASAQTKSRLTYYDNGQVHAKTANTKNGKLHGTSKTWYKSGQLWSKNKWKNGEQVKFKTFNENGNRSYSLRKKRWKLHVKMWHANGQI